MTCRPNHAARFPDFAVGNQVARRHGVWAADVADAAVEAAADLFDEDTRRRYPLVTLLAGEVFVRWQRARADIAERGEVIGEGADAKAHPLLSHVATWERTLLELSSRFGLDRKSEADLARSQAAATLLATDLDGLRERGRLARLAAEERMALEASTSSPMGGMDEDSGTDGASPPGPPGGALVGDDEAAR